MTDTTVADRRLHPATTLLGLVRGLPSTALGLPAAFAFVSDVGWPTVLALAAALVSVAALGNYVMWRRFRYGIGVHELVIESGLLNRTRRSIPFDRIQDVDIERALLHRLSGLAKVRIETGGAASDEGVLDSVDTAEADRLRAAIRAGKAGAAAAPDAAAPAEHLVFALGLRALLLSGVFNISFLYLAGLFAVLQAFEPWIPFDIYDAGRWLGMVEGRIADGVTIGAVLFLLLVALLLGVVTGVVRTVSRDFGFRLLAAPGRFRRERGLFTRSEVVVAKPRIQLGLRRSGPLGTLLGWHTLVFQTLSAGKDGAGHQIVAPFASGGETAAVLGETGRLLLPDPAVLAMVSRGHIWRTLASTIALPVLAIAVGTVVWRPALSFALLLPLFALQPFVARRFHRYALVDGLLFVQRGVWWRKLWIVPAANAQAVSIRRSWLQRKLGLATLLVDTAGASRYSDPRIVDLKFDRARELLHRLSAYSGRKSGTDK